MVDRSAPAEEMGAYRRRHAAAKPFGADNIGPATAEFIRDFETLADALTAQGLGQQPKPSHIAIFPELRTDARAEGLPLGPLRRMVRLVGVDVVRFLAVVGSAEGYHQFRLHLRPRMEKEFKRGNRYKASAKRSELITYGHRVLELERDRKLKRGPALTAAANELRLGVGSFRSLERYFQQFSKLCLRQGYVPHPHEALGFPPAFTLADLDARDSDTALK